MIAPIRSSVNVLIRHRDCNAATRLTKQFSQDPGCPGLRFGTVVSSVYFPAKTPGEAMRRLLLPGAGHHGFGGCSQDFANEKKIGQQRAQMAGGVEVVD